MVSVPKVRLNNGVDMPIFGLGTWQRNGAQNDVVETVKHAIDIGYRLFDCSPIHNNEQQIGQAIQDKIKEGTVKREDLFIVSKLWCNSHRPDSVETALKTSLKNLQLEELDLYLIQWPHGFLESDIVDMKPPHHYSDVAYVETWKAMESVYRKGLSRAIGVSNFNSKQIDRVLNIGTVFPQVNQVECHPYLNQIKLRKYCEAKGIVVMAYGPLGGPRINVDSCFDLLDDKRIGEIAERYARTPAQILLRYGLQVGNVVVAKSFNKGRMSENINIFDFYLAPEDISFINSLDCGGRIFRFDGAKDHVHYPFSADVGF